MSAPSCSSTRCDRSLRSSPHVSRFGSSHFVFPSSDSGRQKFHTSRMLKRIIHTAGLPDCSDVLKVGGKKREGKKKTHSYISFLQSFVQDLWSDFEKKGSRFLLFLLRTKVRSSSSPHLVLFLHCHSFLGRWLFGGRLSRSASVSSGCSPGLQESFLLSSLIVRFTRRWDLTRRKSQKSKSRQPRLSFKIWEQNE